MKPYIYHTHNYSKFWVCLDILMSWILFIRTSTYVSKILFYIAFMRRYFFLVHNHFSLTQKICLDRRKKIQNKGKDIFHHKTFRLKKKTGNYTNKSIQPWGMCNSRRFLVEAQMKRKKKHIKSFCIIHSNFIWVLSLYVINIRLLLN